MDSHGGDSGIDEEMLYSPPASSGSCELDLACSPTSTSSVISSPRPRTPSPDSSRPAILESKCLQKSLRPSTSPQKGCLPSDSTFTERCGIAFLPVREPLSLGLGGRTTRAHSALRLPALPRFLINRQRHHGKEEETLGDLGRQGFTVGNVVPQIPQLSSEKIARLEELRQEEVGIAAGRRRIAKVGRESKRAHPRPRGSSRNLIGTRGATPIPKMRNVPDFNVEYLFSSKPGSKPLGLCATVEEMEAKYEKHKERQRAAVMAVRERRAKRRRQLAERMLQITGSGAGLAPNELDRLHDNQKDAGKERRKDRIRRQNQDISSMSLSLANASTDSTTSDSRNTRRRLY